MRIAIVNDQPMAVEAMRRVLSSAAGHEVAWIARDGQEAVQLCSQDRPNLILMDLIMPVMGGVEATRRIMKETPCGILIVTATVDGNSAKTFEALGAGALDAVNTPSLGDGTSGGMVLLAKIRMLSHLLGESGTKFLAKQGEGIKSGAIAQNRLVAIGASAGGPAALAEILANLPAEFPAGVVIVQHLDEQFAAGLAQWLQLHSQMPVRLAREGDEPAGGTVLVAGTADHLVFRSASMLKYTPNPADYVYRPSVDEFFQSIVRYWQGEAVGVLLTGMGRDGAKGLKELRNAGYHTIAQDRTSSVVYGMPKAAAALDAAVQILPLAEIAPSLMKLFSPRSSKQTATVL